MARKRFTFWLDDTKSTQERLIGWVDDLKENRLFSKTIRQGIELIVSLREGRLDVLFAMFPWVQAEFLEYVQSLPQDDETTARNVADEWRKIENARAELERERQALEQQRQQIKATAIPVSDIQQQLQRIEQAIHGQQSPCLSSPGGGKIT